MYERIIGLLCALLCLLVSSIQAFGSAMDMGPGSLGVEYHAILRGQTITKREIPSHEQLHGMALCYAPFSYGVVKAGAGVEKFDVDPYSRVGFNGGFGFAAFGDAMLQTPSFVKGILRVVGGSSISYFRSRDDKGYCYSAAVYGPYAGLAVAAGKHAALRMGGRGHWIDGAMSNTKTDADYGPFSNGRAGRGFADLTLRSPYEDNMYFGLHAEASPGFSTEWYKGPTEAAVSVTIGFLIKADRKAEQMEKKSAQTFPSFEKMNERADEMDEKLK